MKGRRELSEITHIVIHHSASPSGSRRWRIEDVDDWHREAGYRRTARPSASNSLRHVGYHYVIHTPGDVAIGRELVEVGAHCLYGLNTTSVGICLVGSGVFTIQQWRALAVLVSGLQQLIGALRVTGHCQHDWRKRDCPGFDVPAWYAGGMEPVEDLICALR